MALIPDDALWKLNEFWKAQIDSFPELVREALDPRSTTLVDGMTNTDVLTNLESFATVVAIKANVGIAIMRKLVENTIKGRKLKEDKLRALQTDPEAWMKFIEKYPTKVEQDTMMAELRSKKIWMLIEPFIERECYGLKRTNCERFLRGLVDHNLLELRSRGREEEGFYSYQLALSDIWSPILTIMERDSNEIDAYSERLGKLLYMGIFSEGIQPYKPLVLMLYSGKATENADGDYEITEDDILHCYASCGMASYKASIMAAHDSDKVERVRFFSKYDGKKRVIPKSRKAVLELVRRRAIARLRRMGLSV